MGRKASARSTSAKASASRRSFSVEDRNAACVRPRRTSAGIVGFGAAAETRRLESSSKKRRVWRSFVSASPGNSPADCRSRISFGHPVQRLPGHLSFGFRGQEGKSANFCPRLDAAGVAVSAGSACNANHAGEPSGVLLAMGYDPEQRSWSRSLSLGRFSTRARSRSLPRNFAAGRGVNNDNACSSPHRGDGRRSASGDVRIK